MSTDQQAIRDQLRDYIVRTFLPGEDPSNLHDDTALKSSGILDSMSTLNLVSYVEETFSLKLKSILGKPVDIILLYIYLDI